MDRQTAEAMGDPLPPCPACGGQLLMYTNFVNSHEMFDCAECDAFMTSIHGIHRKGSEEARARLERNLMDNDAAKAERAKQ